MKHYINQPATKFQMAAVVPHTVEMHLRLYGCEVYYVSSASCWIYYKWIPNPFFKIHNSWT